MSEQRKVVFQGEVGANSHMACNSVYPEYQAIPCPTFEDCFHAIENGDAELGMIPIETPLLAALLIFTIFCHAATCTSLASISCQSVFS